MHKIVNITTGDTVDFRHKFVLQQHYGVVADLLLRDCNGPQIRKKWPQTVYST